MPGNESGSIVSSSLAARVATARATHAASPHQPAPPPDKMASPWSSIESIHNEYAERMAEVARAEGARVAAIPPKQKAPSKESESTKQEVTSEELEPIPNNAWKMLDQLLTKWSRQILHTGRERANFDLARSLMSCGALLLRARLPVEAVASIVRLSNELAEAGGQVDEDDKRIEMLRRRLRSEVFDTTTGEDKCEREDEEEDDREE